METRDQERVGSDVKGEVRKSRSSLLKIFNRDSFQHVTKEERGKRKEDRKSRDARRAGKFGASKRKQNAGREVKQVERPAKTKFSENISLMESLILAQNERWRRG